MPTYDSEYCHKQIARIKNFMRSDNDPDLELELKYYQNELKRLNQGADKWQPSRP
jgi:hypothetical protein